MMFVKIKLWSVRIAFAVHVRECHPREFVSQRGILLFALWLANSTQMIFHILLLLSVVASMSLVKLTFLVS